MKCDFCYRMCEIPEAGMGFCKSRINDCGIIKDRCYGGLVSIAVDPVEKKPLYHFLPGSSTLSIAMQGCNFTCDFCQNYEISQRYFMKDAVDPSAIVEYALSYGCPSISYTYSEPIVWQDYMLDVAKLSRKRNIRNIMVTNGSFSEASLERVLPYIDAYNVDLKGDENFYSEICHSSFSPVLSSIRRISEYGTHLEVTTMVIEGVHDESMIRYLGRCLSSCNVKVWHLSRFFPMYLMGNRRPTSENFLKRMLKIAVECKIPYVYPGNSKISGFARCPSCSNDMDRPGADGICPYCGEKLYGVYRSQPLSRKC